MLKGINVDKLGMANRVVIVKSKTLSEEKTEDEDRGIVSNRVSD